MWFRLTPLPCPGLIAFLGRFLVVVVLAQRREVVRRVRAVPIDVVDVGGAVGNGAQ